MPGTTMVRPITDLEPAHSARVAPRISERSHGGEGPFTRLKTATQVGEPRFASLIERMAQGDQEALAALYDATSALVYSLALRILHDQGAAEEVTIEVYMQAYRIASSYDPRRGTPSVWLLTLTHSRAIDCLRRDAVRQQHETSLELAETLPTSNPDPEATELQRIVQRALAALSPEQRQVIEIAYYEGLSHSQIAARLGQPLGTVKSRIRTGMMVLHDLLQPFLATE